MDEAGALVQIAAFEGGRGGRGLPTVGIEDIAAVVSQWTGIPVSKVPCAMACNGV